MERFEVEVLSEDAERTVALVRLQGTGQTVVNATSSNTYTILWGHGFFSYPDTSMVQGVTAGDVVTVPAGTTYRDEGNLVVLCTSVPPFDPSSVTVVE